MLCCVYVISDYEVHLMSLHIDKRVFFSLLLFKIMPCEKSLSRCLHRLLNKKFLRQQCSLLAHRCSYGTKLKAC